MVVAVEGKFGEKESINAFLVLTQIAEVTEDGLIDPYRQVKGIAKILEEKKFDSS